jgi:hypothetical protein
MKIRKPNRLKEYDYSTAGWYYVKSGHKPQKSFWQNSKQENGVK